MKVLDYDRVYQESFQMDVESVVALPTIAPRIIVVFQMEF